MVIRGALIEDPAKFCEERIQESVEACGRSAASQDAGAQGLAERVTGALRCRNSARAPTGMLSAAPISVRPLTGMLSALSTSLEPTSVTIRAPDQSGLPASRPSRNRKLSRPNASLDSGAARSPAESVRRRSTRSAPSAADSHRTRSRRRQAPPAAKARRWPPRFPRKGARSSRGPARPPGSRALRRCRSRNVDDPSADERPPIDDPDD